ncbi:hypothetical protein E2C01_022182 [Portunus trituberculatus]|uniref:Uncharacterized protein n=1 Tax=Portunus trituberculatus TaxID=210409 RepID=A0A5B7E6Y2_PORTR|nr:hypothetical protein [Portunus trituberculatus]
MFSTEAAQQQYYEKFHQNFITANTAKVPATQTEANTECDGHTNDMTMQQTMVPNGCHSVLCGLQTFFL